MMKVKECKALARETLLGRYTTAAAAVVLASMLPYVLLMMVFSASGYMFCHSGILNSILQTAFAFSFPFLLGAVMLMIFGLTGVVLFGAFLKIGRTKLFLNICRGRHYSIGDISYAFHQGAHPWRVIAAELIIWLIAVLIRWIPKAVELALPLMLGSSSFNLGISVLVSAVSIVLSVLITVRFMFAPLILIDKSETELGRAFSLSNELMYGRTFKGFWLMTFSFLFWMLLMAVCNLSALWIIPYIECTKIVFYMDADDTLWQLPGAKKKRGDDASAEGESTMQEEPFEQDEANDDTADAAETETDEINADTADDAEAAGEVNADAAETIESAAEVDEKTAETLTAKDSWEQIISEMNINIPQNK